MLVSQRVKKKLSLKNICELLFTCDMCVLLLKAIYVLNGHLTILFLHVSNIAAAYYK